MITQIANILVDEAGLPGTIAVALARRLASADSMEAIRALLETELDIGEVLELLPEIAAIVL